MKKSTILGVLTAAALITTSAATYAAWDQTQFTTTSTVNVRDGVKVSSAAEFDLSGGEALTAADQLVYTGTVNFTTENTGNKKLKLTPVVSGNEVQADDYTIALSKSGTSLSGDAADGYTDASPTASNEYTVTLTVKDETNLGGKTLTVNVTAELID